MGWLIDFFEWLGDVITMAFDFLVNIIESTTLLLDYLGLITDFSSDFITSLPSWLQAFGTITITICILYMILGRSAGRSKSD